MSSVERHWAKRLVLFTDQIWSRVNLAGYTLLRASDLAEATKLVENHPFISRGGTLQVSEAIDLGG